MSRRKTSYRPFGGSGPLTIYWQEGPFGPAREADNGRGVGWFSASGDLLGVELDDVAPDDEQSMSFGAVRVAVVMQGGRCSVRVSTPKRRTRARHAA